MCVFHVFPSVTTSKLPALICTRKIIASCAVLGCLQAPVPVQQIEDDVVAKARHFLRDAFDNSANVNGLVQIHYNCTNIRCFLISFDI